MTAAPNDCEDEEEGEIPHWVSNSPHHLRALARHSALCSMVELQLRAAYEAQTGVRTTHSTRRMPVAPGLPVFDPTQVRWMKRDGRNLPLQRDASPQEFAYPVPPLLWYNECSRRLETSKDPTETTPEFDRPRAEMRERWYELVLRSAGTRRTFLNRLRPSLEAMLQVPGIPWPLPHSVASRMYAPPPAEVLQDQADEEKDDDERPHLSWHVARGPGSEGLPPAVFCRPDEKRKMRDFSSKHRDFPRHGPFARALEESPEPPPPLLPGQKVFPSVRNCQPGTLPSVPDERTPPIKSPDGQVFQQEHHQQQQQQQMSYTSNNSSEADEEETRLLAEAAGDLFDVGGDEDDDPMGQTEDEQTTVEEEGELATNDIYSDMLDDLANEGTSVAEVTPPVAKPKAKSRSRAKPKTPAPAEAAGPSLVNMGGVPIPGPPVAATPSPRKRPPPKKKTPAVPDIDSIPVTYIDERGIISGRCPDTGMMITRLDPEDAPSPKKKTPSKRAVAAAGTLNMRQFAESVGVKVPTPEQIGALIDVAVLGADVVHAKAEAAASAKKLRNPGVPASAPFTPKVTGKKRPASKADQDVQETVSDNGSASSAPAAKPPPAKRQKTAAPAPAATSDPALDASITKQRSIMLGIITKMRKGYDAMPPGDRLTHARTFFEKHFGSWDPKVVEGVQWAIGLMFDFAPHLDVVGVNPFAPDVDPKEMQARRLQACQAMFYLTSPPHFSQTSFDAAAYRELYEAYERSQHQEPADEDDEEAQLEEEIEDIDPFAV